MLTSGDPMPENLRTVKDSSGNTWTRHESKWARTTWGASVTWEAMLSLAGPVEPLTTDDPAKPS
jgi:hypothetical protein